MIFIGRVFAWSARRIQRASLGIKRNLQPLFLHSIEHSEKLSNAGTALKRSRLSATMHLCSACRTGIRNYQSNIEGGR
jgi:hypothetical protein